MKKRILSCLMALALCLTLLPTAALAADSDGMNHNPHTGTELKMDGDTLKKGTGEWDVSDVKLWKPSDTPVSAYVLDGALTIWAVTSISPAIRLLLPNALL